MHRRLVLVVLGLLQYLGALIAADPAPPALNQPVPRCQQERVAVITKRSILRLARDLITITVTSTSTDTTDCTCTETSSTAFVSTDVSITLASSLPTSSPFAMATTTSAIEPITTEAAMDSNPVVSVIPTVITADSPTTVIDWRSTTVTSIVTVESVITEVDTITKTVISVVPSVVTADRPTTVTDWRYTTVPSIVTVGSVITEAGTNPKTVISVVPSVVTADRATTLTDWRNTVLTSSVTVVDVSSASSDLGIVLLGNISTILSAETLPRAESTDSRVSTLAILSGDSSPDRFTTVTVNHYSNTVQPVTRIAYETPDVTLSLEDSPTGLSTNAEASAGEAVRNKPGYTTVFTNDNQKTRSELETQSFISADTSTWSSLGELGDPPATMATDPSREAVSAPKTQISATTASTETPVTPSGEPYLLGNSPGKVTETAGIGESALPTTSLSAPSLSICPSRIINPTFTPLAPLPKNYTWGCPPSLLCNPSKQPADGECNFEAGPPADTYYCRPEECIRSPTLTLPVLSGPPASYERIEHYNITRGYFNLNPTEFGLGYDIFDMNDAAGGWRRDWSIKIPGKCYVVCNNAMLEAESSGKTDDLCDSDSAFLTLVRACRACVDSVPLSRSWNGELPEFQQFLFYCEESSHPTSPSQSRPVNGYSSAIRPIRPFSKAATSTPVVFGTARRPIATSQYDTQRTTSVSLDLTKSTSLATPFSTPTDHTYTGAASTFCPPLLLVIAPFVLSTI